MSIFNTSEHLHLRKCYFEKDQVPTLSVMTKYMSPALADVYFKSMSPKLKVVAGLQPPMKGAGSSWYVTPEDLLQGRAVLKPLKKEYMSQLSWHGIDEIGMRLIEVRYDRMKSEIKQTIDQSDRNWKLNVDRVCYSDWEQCSEAATKLNTEHMRQSFSQFITLYTSSLTKIQDLLFTAAINEIKRIKLAAFQKMSTKYQHSLQHQAAILTNTYIKNLEEEKVKLKTKFINNLERTRTKLGNKLHDISLEKHVAVQKLRTFLERQKLSCQIYVALKEREECLKEMELSEKKHSKTIKQLKRETALKDDEIHLAEQQEKKRQEVDRIWKKKVLHVVKNFQIFVSYCLKTLPEHADFFINVEKLMLLQLSESLDNPSVESIIVSNVEQPNTPVPRPHPYYLFCDKSFKPNINQDLCPIHCTASASQLPVIVIHKRFIYAACDNFEQFTDKIKDYVHGKLGDTADFEDNRDYSHYVPIECTPSQKTLELKLESSLFQVLQHEIETVQTPVDCAYCRIPYCFDCNRSSTESSLVWKDPYKIVPTPAQCSIPSISSDKNILTRQKQLELAREPKCEDFFQYVKPKKCECTKTAKKHLLENLPAYMRKMSYYDAPELLNYETCPYTTLKTLVKTAKSTEKTSSLQKVPSRTKNVSTQFDESEFEYLCTCFSDHDIQHFVNTLTAAKNVLDTFATDHHSKIVDGSVSQTYLAKESKSFIMARALSLKELIDQSPDVKELFKRSVCNFDL